MAKALTLVKIAPGKEREVDRLLKELESENIIKGTYPLFGSYDQLVYFEYRESNVDDEINFVGNYVIDKIRSIKGVVDTLTHLAAEWS